MPSGCSSEHSCQAVAAAPRGLVGGCGERPADAVGATAAHSCCELLSLLFPCKPIIHLSHAQHGQGAMLIAVHMRTMEGTDEETVGDEIASSRVNIGLNAFDTIAPSHR